MAGACLIRRQADVLAWLRERRRRGGRPPKLDETRRGLRLRSRGPLHKHGPALRYLPDRVRATGRMRSYRATRATR